MLFTRRALFLLLLDAVLLAGATFEPLLLDLAVAYLLVVLAMVLADRWLTPAPRDFALERIHDQRLSLGASNLVVVRVTHHGRRAVRVLLRDEPPVQFRSDAVYLGEERARKRLAISRRGVRLALSREIDVVPARLDPRATREFRYHVRPPRRGDYRFGDLNIRWHGVLGLIVRQARFPAAAGVKVYPNLLDIRKYEILVRRGQLQEMGLRHTRLLGSGTEFERLRDYQLDDEFRRIDWKAMARRGKPITREFETERSQNIIAMVDAGRLMRSPVGDLAKVDYVVNAVLMLSYVAGLRGDKVGMLAFADEVTRYLAPRSGKGQFYRMLSLLYALESQAVESDYARAFAYLGAKHKKRSLIVIFSDLASGLAARTLVSNVVPLYPRHLPLLVAISDPAVVDLARATPTDSARMYERAVAEQLLDERALTMESLRRGGVMTLDVPANKLTVAVVNKYLELKARGGI
ncbi:MAG: DUF58 domain-containing protein [Chloroflexi bacterium]|nr:DUF58 domain-containing protein [Chloroflexota bacterium]